MRKFALTPGWLRASARLEPAYGERENIDELLEELVVQLLNSDCKTCHATPSIGAATDVAGCSGQSIKGSSQRSPKPSGDP